MYEIEQEFRDSIEAIWPRLHRLALRLTRDSIRADELAQQTVLKMLENEAQFMPGTEILDWAFQILRNEIRTKGRRRKREVEDPDDLLAHAIRASDNPEAALMAKDQISFLGLLPASQARALVLNTQGYSIKEISQALGIAEGTAKSMIWRAKQQLCQLGFEPS